MSVYQNDSVVASVLRYVKRIFSGALLAMGCLMAVLPILAYGATTETAERKNQGRFKPLEEMRRQVSAASVDTPRWDGPQKGPAAAAGRTIAIISEDLRNGGILGVAQGVREAAKILGWKVRVFDAGGTAQGREKAASEALAVHPDGVILNGADARVMHSWLTPFAFKGIPVVGWHVGPVAGSLMDGPVAMNVSTDPLEVARITAMAAIVAAEERAGVVIFTDSNFEIAMAKANAMADIIRSCAKCTLLEVRDVPISKSAETMPTVIRELLTRYGGQWTHVLAINDIYFDYAVPEFILAGPGARHISLLSAGDGSSAAFLRIQTGTFQTGTVAEPLNLHGWQLVDELNRLLANEPVSGYVVPAHLVTPTNVLHGGGSRFRYDPDNGYRDAYRRIWGR
jgi:ribose transport system substrate-binding protein